MEYIETVIHALDDEKVQAYLDFLHIIHEAYYFFDFEPSVEYRLAEMRVPYRENNPHHEILVWDENRIVAKGSLSYLDFEVNTNTDFCEIHIEVIPNFTKRHIGSRLLARLLDIAVEKGKSKVEMWVSSIGLNGKLIEIIEKFPVRKATQERCNRLRRENINLDFLKSIEWRQNTLKHFTTISMSRLEFFEHIIEDEDFREEIADFYNETTSMIPKEDSSQEDFIRTGNDILEMAINGREKPVEAIIYLMKDGNKVIAISDTTYPKGDPRRVQTGFTGVRKEYQGRGIASYLKILMVKDYIEMDGFEYIDTENAQSNSSMLKINDNLGFKYEYSWLSYEAEVDDLRNYLRRKGYSQNIEDKNE
ncbi:MAG: GNAT family N-acetyltransferase [Candidatus Heimdallarchaeota archaeon]|nr:GNAT family N-acetyltransferase [Candidatus Heimdallarchaeota archaeon]